MSVRRAPSVPWATALVAGLALLVGGAFVLAMPYSRKPIDDYIARAKAAGKPVTLRDTLGPDPTPDANGAPEIASAGKWMDDHDGAPETWKVVGPWSDGAGERWYENITDDQRRALDAFLADAKPFFDGVAAGLAKPRLRTPTPSGDSAPDYGDDARARVRVIHVLAARAQAATRTSDRLAAAEMLAALDVRWECRVAIDEYVSALSMTDAATSIRLLVEPGGMDAVLLRARFDGPFREPWLPRFREGVRREHAAQLDRLRTADLDGYGSVVRSGPTSRPWTSIALERIVARVHALRDGGIVPENSPADLARALPTTEQFETAPTDSYPRLAAEIAAVASAAPAGSLRAMLVSWHRSYADVLARTDAACRLARIALAASEFRARRGDFPDSLDRLAPMFPDGVPLDPFTDAPFVYAKTPTGVRIASAGRLAADPPLDEATLRERCLVWELKR